MRIDKRKEVEKKKQLEQGTLSNGQRLATSVLKELQGLQLKCR